MLKILQNVISSSEAKLKFENEVRSKLSEMLLFSKGKNIFEITENFPAILLTFALDTEDIPTDSYAYEIIDKELSVIYASCIRKALKNFFLNLNLGEYCDNSEMDLDIKKYSKEETWLVSLMFSSNGVGKRQISCRALLLNSCILPDENIENLKEYIIDEIERQNSTSITPPLTTTNEIEEISNSNDKKDTLSDTSGESILDIESLGIKKITEQEEYLNKEDEIISFEDDLKAPAFRHEENMNSEEKKPLTEVDTLLDLTEKTFSALDEEDVTDLFESFESEEQEDKFDEVHKEVLGIKSIDTNEKLTSKLSIVAKSKLQKEIMPDTDNIIDNEIDESVEKVEYEKQIEEKMENGNNVENFEPEDIMSQRKLQETEKKDIEDEFDNTENPVFSEKNNDKTLDSNGTVDKSLESLVTSIKNKINVDKPENISTLDYLRNENKELTIYIPDTFENEISSIRYDELHKAYSELCEYYTKTNKISYMRSQTNDYPREDFIGEIQRYIETKMNDRIPPEDRPLLMKMLLQHLFGYSKLTAIINDERVSDIKILSAKKINAKIGNKHYTVENLQFDDEESMNTFIEALLKRNHVVYNKETLTFTDSDFHKDYILRFNICMPGINSTRRPYLHIRKVAKEKRTIEDLINAGMLTEDIAIYLMHKAKTSKGIVFSGPSASGKTSLMNALLDETDKEKSILVIQESEELFTKVHPNAMFQHITPQYDLDALGINGLLCDVGYFIIGEIKGKEARNFIRAANTGHMCWCSVHSSSAKAALPRLADYVKYGSDYSVADALKMLSDLEVLIYIEDYKIKQIDEVVGFDETVGDIIYKTVFKRNI